MKNRAIYQKDPAAQKLVNEGVVSVNDQKEEVLRYELETFVCDGQYEKGIDHILRTFLGNLNHAQQAGVWVSGFYGSGKSHLVKILQNLWKNTEFSDGASARGIAALPENIRELFTELQGAGKRHGGLHAASGTLKANDDSNSVRAALLAVVFKSVGLPAKYHLASFVMWLKEEGLFDIVKESVEKSGREWTKQVQRLHVSEAIRAALVTARPSLFFDEKSCRESLANQFPSGKDVSSDDMVKAIRQALTLDGKFPLTLIVLDEVQQYINDDSQRSIDVQEVVEACCKNIGSKLLFVATGQTAVTGTSNLKKLEGRFTIRVELSDADVDVVIRKVILAKKTDAIAPIEKEMQTNLGEISRHLSGTTIGHRQDDLEFFSQDYPILPVRRRFWEHTLRVLDQTGTDSQLRNQLSMVHKVIQTNLDDAVGNVVPADHLYFDSADKLLQARILPRKVHEKTMIWIEGGENEKLQARACGLVFLINKLAGSNNEVGIKATIDTIADLMVKDLTVGSGSLRSKLPALLDKCELLMKVGEEYRIQTEESTAWNDEFLSQKNGLANEAHRIESERDDRIRRKFGELVKKLSLTHGTSRVTRDLYPVFDSQLPSDKDKKIYLWVRDGWGIDENTVRVDARQAGNQSPSLFVFIPKRSADDLRYHLISYKAATSTLEKRGVPNSPEGTEARSSMETTRQNAEAKITELLDEAFSGARVFQGGGNEIVGNNLQEMVLEAAENGLQRLYPQFNIADHGGWDKVYSHAKQGAPDALKAVGDEGEPGRNPVCKQILGFIAGGKKGADVRIHFETSPFGWSRDAVDGGLQVLLLTGLVRAEDERGLGLNPKDLERKAMGKTTLKVESTAVTTPQRLKIRKLFQKLNCQAVKQGEDLAIIPEFLQKMQDMANLAGGEAPKPQNPDKSFLDEIRLTAGNEQLLTLYNRRDELAKAIDSWKDLGERIEKRWPAWLTLKRLAAHSKGLRDAELLCGQVEHLEEQRLLLEDPDPITPLIKNLTQLLRNSLNTLSSAWEREWQAGEAKFEEDKNWQQLEPEQRYALRQTQGLIESARPSIEVDSTGAVLKSLDTMGMTALKDRIAAMPGRYGQALVQAAKLLEPEVQEISLPTPTLKTEADIDVWLSDARELLLSKLKNGPVIPH